MPAAKMVHDVLRSLPDGLRNALMLAYAVSITTSSPAVVVRGRLGG
jgi:hypothetical protein